MRYPLPIMTEQGYGRIISIASGYGVVGGAEGAAYAALKGGLLAFTKSAAAEVFQQSVTISCIAPGDAASTVSGITFWMKNP